MVNKNAMDNGNMNITRNERKTAKEIGNSRGIISSIVTVFSILVNIGGLILGLILISLGLFVRSFDEVPVTVIDAKVESVKWNDEDGCKPKATTKNQGNIDIQWKCDVVATYNLGGSEEEYTFKSTGSRYIKNRSITLYRFNKDGTITHVDPNSWKKIWRVLFGIGVIITVAYSVWIWMCTKPWGRVMCATKAASNVFG